MDFNTLMWLGIALGAYVVGCGLLVLIKYIKNKRKFKKEKKAHEDKE